MRNLNYHHLNYFWHVAREGSIRSTASRLHVTPSTISGQITQLEEAVGEPLFRRAGGGMTLTQLGEIVFGYAEEIFSSGRELQQYLERRSGENFVKLEIGILDAVPKMLIRMLLQPIVDKYPSAHFIFHEGREDELAALLDLHQLDIVLTDSPMSSAGQGVHSQLLGSSPIGLYAAPDLAAKHRDFPESFEGAPLLVPQTMTVVRRELDRYFAQLGVHPKIVGEFQDTALMKAFGQASAGLFPAPVVIEDDLFAQLGVEKVAQLDEVREELYAVSARQHAHPALELLFESAQAVLSS